MHRPWIPINLLTFDAPYQFPPGSLVFIQPYAGKGLQAKPAIRFDMQNQDGNVEKWLFWLHEPPWGLDADRNVSRCSDLYYASSRAAGLSRRDGLCMDIELGPPRMLTENADWQDAPGSICFTDQGLCISGKAYENRYRFVVPISITQWCHVPEARQLVPQPIWLSDWRLKLWDGDAHIFGYLSFEGTPHRVP